MAAAVASHLHNQSCLIIGKRRPMTSLFTKIHFIHFTKILSDPWAQLCENIWEKLKIASDFVLIEMSQKWGKIGQNATWIEDVKLTKKSVKTDQKLVRMYKNSQNVSEYAKMYQNTSKCSGISNGHLMHENYPILIKTGPSLNEM